MERPGLIDDVLQYDRVCDQFVVDDRLLLIRWIVRPQEAVFAEGLVFREPVVALDFGGALMHSPAHRIIHDPVEQESRSHRFAQLLQGQRKPIARAVAIDPGEYGGRGECTALDRDAQLHEERIMLTNQRPVDCPAE